MYTFGKDCALYLGCRLFESQRDQMTIKESLEYLCIPDSLELSLKLFLYNEQFEPELFTLDRETTGRIHKKSLYTYGFLNFVGRLYQEDYSHPERVHYHEGDRK